MFHNRLLCNLGLSENGIPTNSVYYHHFRNPIRFSYLWRHALRIFQSGVDIISTRSIRGFVQKPRGGGPFSGEQGEVPISRLFELFVRANGNKMLTLQATRWSCGSTFEGRHGTVQTKVSGGVQTANSREGTQAFAVWAWGCLKNRCLIGGYRHKN